MAMAYKIVQGENVPGGHRVFWDGVREPFLPPMHECNSIELRPSDIVVDIGAYVGTYAIRCARTPVQKITAYEPSPESYNLLSMTKAPNLEVVHGAIVGDDRDDVYLYVSKGIGVTNSVVATRGKGWRVKVPAFNYSEAIKDATIVKLDIEGGEWLIPDIVQPHVRAYIIDFHPVPGINWVAKAEAVMRELDAAGYTRIVNPDWSNGWTRNGSFLKEMETQGQCDVLMNGEQCCGCARDINASGKAICSECAKSWLPKHKIGYEIYDINSIEP